MLWFAPCLSWWRADFKSCPGFLGSQVISIAVHKFPDQERETCTLCLFPCHFLFCVWFLRSVPILGLILQQALQYCKNTSPEILLGRKKLCSQTAAHTCKSKVFIIQGILNFIFCRGSLFSSFMSWTVPLLILNFYKWDTLIFFYLFFNTINNTIILIFTTYVIRYN